MLKIQLHFDQLLCRLSLTNFPSSHFISFHLTFSIFPLHVSHLPKTNLKVTAAPPHLRVLSFHWTTRLRHQWEGNNQKADQSARNITVSAIVMVEQSPRTPPTLLCQRRCVDGSGKMGNDGKTGSGKHKSKSARASAQPPQRSDRGNPGHQQDPRSDYEDFRDEDNKELEQFVGRHKPAHVKESNKNGLPRNSPGKRMARSRNQS